MPNSKQIVYLSQAQYVELIANGSITVDGVTVTYDENDIYVTPQAEPVTDVRVAGTSVTANGVANIPTGSATQFGVMRAGGPTFGMTANNGIIAVSGADSSQVKAGGGAYLPITTLHQHEATFYGLAKASGDTTQSSSSNSVGTYTPEAKGAIQKMLGVSDLIATEENNLIASKAYAIGDIFTANGKLYKATAAITVDGAIIPAVEGEEITGANCEETNVGEGFPHDVQINGISIIDNGVANVPIAGEQDLGAVKILTTYGIGIQRNGTLSIIKSDSNRIKLGRDVHQPIVPFSQHESVFYGLSKVAGVDLTSETITLGTYPETSKTAIRTMLGATSSNVIAVQDTQPTDSDTKIWLPETAETPVEVPTVAEMEQALAGKVGDVQVNGTSVVSDGVANIPYATNSKLGLVQGSGSNGVKINANGILSIDGVTSTMIKTGTDSGHPITANHGYEIAFYGLAKAAGDTTQSVSDNDVGTYTDEAKTAIRTMLSAVGNEDYATENNYGLVKVNSNYGISQNADSGALQIRYATAAQCKNRTGSTAYQPLTVFTENAAAFYGLAYAAGDTTMASSTAGIGIYTDNAKASIKAMLGIQDGSTGTVDVSGTTPTIAAVENTRYVCGEVTSLSFTPPTSGISIVRFTSGSTVTVLTIPSTVKFPEWFDPTSLETNTIYEICVTDGVYGAVMSWAL